MVRIPEISISGDENGSSAAPYFIEGRRKVYVPEGATNGESENNEAA
jgi:hypothetical protein